jgi:hypothetical protein
VPVSDEMIETLVGGFPAESPEIGPPPDDVEAAPSVDPGDDQVAAELEGTSELPAAANISSTSQPGIDHLLKIARELEYGLIELAEALPAESTPAASSGPIDASGLGGVLVALQSDDELQALRDAVETARQRPRDVDVMLDLVLRAEAIAAVIEERDKLKAAIEAATGGSTPDVDADETAFESTSDGDDTDEQDLDVGDATDDGSESDSYAST